MSTAPKPLVQVKSLKRGLTRQNTTANKKYMYLICHNVQKQRGGRSEGGVPRQGHVATNDPGVGTESSDFWRQRRYVFCLKNTQK